jgi:hypothetical protein
MSIVSVEDERGMLRADEARSRQVPKGLRRTDETRSRQIPKGWYWLGAMVVSIAMWWALIKGVMALI